MNNTIGYIGQIQLKRQIGGKWYSKKLYNHGTNILFNFLVRVLALETDKLTATYNEIKLPVYFDIIRVKRQGAIHEQGTSSIFASAEDFNMYGESILRNQSKVLHKQIQADNSGAARTPDRLKCYVTLGPQELRESDLNSPGNGYKKGDTFDYYFILKTQHADLSNLSTKVPLDEVLCWVSVISGESKYPIEDDEMQYIDWFQTFANVSTTRIENK